MYSNNQSMPEGGSEDHFETYESCNEYCDTLNEAVEGAWGELNKDYANTNSAGFKLGNIETPINTKKAKEYLLSTEQKDELDKFAKEFWKNKGTLNKDALLREWKRQKTKEILSKFAYKEDEEVSALDTQSYIERRAETLLNDHLSEYITKGPRYRNLYRGYLENIKEHNMPIERTPEEARERADEFVEEAICEFNEDTDYYIAFENKYHKRMIYRLAGGTSDDRVKIVPRDVLNRISEEDRERMIKRLTDSAIAYRVDTIEAKNSTIATFEFDDCEIQVHSDAVITKEEMEETDGKSFADKVSLCLVTNYK